MEHTHAVLSPSRSALNVGDYVLADVVGFRSETLRCKVSRLDDRDLGIAWVTTADLLDAGTQLVLSRSKLRPIEAPSALRHRDGLVTIG